MNVFDLLPRGFAVLAIQFHCCPAGQLSLRSVHDCRYHLQITQQFGTGRGRDLLLRLPLCFEKQFGIIQNAFADRRGALAPGGIQLASLACIAVMLSEDRSHPLAIFEILARDWHQKLQSHLRHDLAFAHLLLDRFRQNFHQRQPPRNPAHATIEPAGQLIERVAETLLQLRE